MSGKPGQMEEIIQRIAELSPDQRRRLQRYLRTSGAWEAEELLTDQNRLEVAPALGVRLFQWRRRRQQQRPTAPQPAVSRPAPQTDDEYRSGVRGKVVVGPPQTEGAPQEPHAMAPLPGQAPERPIEVIFDGGSKGNPGKGYGSYALRWPGRPQQVIQLQFGDQVTNNEAEYDTLIEAVKAIHKRLADIGADPATAQVTIHGDSQLVINQVNGQWKVKEPRLQARCDQARRLLGKFGRWQLSYHPRERSVEVLGH